MRNLTLRILGTVCLVDPAKREDPFKKRLVLPLDTTQDPKEKHIPYVEFIKDDIDNGTGDLGPVYVRKPQSQDSIEYRRFELSGHVVEIANVVADPFIIWDSYEKHIPGMTKVSDKLDRSPRKKCFDPTPDSTLFGGFLDVSHGTLKAGPLDEEFTTFQTTIKDVFTIHSARFSELLFRVEPPIQVRFRKGDETITINLNATKTDLITIGNQPVQVIEGKGDEDVRHHFELYYNLADPPNKPTDPPLPKKFAAIVNGCANTNWP